MVKVKVCPICGNEFTGRAKYCSHECKLKARRSRYAAKAEKAKVVKVCPICGNEFTGTSKDKYCSNECSKLANRRMTIANRFERNRINLDTARSIRDVNPNAQLGTDNNGNLIQLFGSRECESDIRKIESKWAKYAKMEEDIKSSNHH